MDLIKLIDQNVECVATPNGRYLKRSEVFEVVEKFTSTNTARDEILQYLNMALGAIKGHGYITASGYIENAIAKLSPIA